MAKTIGNIVRFDGGISDGEKLGQPNSFRFERSLEFRNDPSKLTLLPRTTKESGNTVIDLPLWADRVGTDTWFYGDAGNIYKRTTAGVWTNEHTAPSSQGNGLAYLGEDQYLYYAQNTSIGRYGQIGQTPKWYDSFLESEGGDPTNTNSLDLEASSSQYASVADTAEHSITGDISIGVDIKPESLPTAGNTMVLVSKWLENGDQRSYKVELATTSDSFGDGSDGALTIAASATEAPIDSACSGTIATKALTATNTSFAAGQRIFIHQTQGTGAGTCQKTSIQSYTAGTITTTDPLNYTYSTGAQVRVMKQYSAVTVNASKTYSAKAWNGTVGGILAWYCSGTTTINGSVNISGVNSGGASFTGAEGIGFFGGDAGQGTGPMESGEGTVGDPVAQTTANGNGGGGAKLSTSGTNQGSGGGGGGNVSSGNAGVKKFDGTPGAGGSISSTNDLTTLTFGGGGGGANAETGAAANGGAAGAGILLVYSNTVTMGASSSVDATGGSCVGTSQGYGGGGGGGGSVLLNVNTATLGTALIDASGGTSTATDWAGGTGGNGAVVVNYITSVTGTTTPTLNSVNDTSLSTTTGYAIKLSISDDGDAEETYSMPLDVDYTTGGWNNFYVTWDASESLATFYQDSISLGTRSGSMTAIDNGTAAFSIGCDFGAASAARNFYDGLIDNVAVWSGILTQTNIKTMYNDELLGTEYGLAGYYELDGDYTDSSANSNTLTAVNAPVFSTDVPFSGVTTRADQDQSGGGNSSTYTLPTTISETATGRQTFVPAKDPQKSIVVTVDTAGTGDWTCSVHDQFNREVATATIVSDDIPSSGVVEFVFTAWRPIIAASYHFHIIDPNNDGLIKSDTLNDLEDALFTTHYQILVSDEYHPIKQFLNVLVIGNERYVATLEAGNIYYPHKLKLPSGYRVRSLAYWREYIAIGTCRGTNITDFDQGGIFFWDGTSSTYNFYIDVPEGGINAMHGSKGILSVLAGYSGTLLEYLGGDSATEVKTMPKLESNKWAEVHPGGLTMWRGMLMISFAGDSNSTEIEKGVYTWGSINDKFSDSLGYSYPLSIGVRTGTDIDLGVVYPSGQDLLIGFKSGTAYGVDKVSVTNNPYSTGTIETLISDLEMISRDKLPLVARADFEALASGESVTIKYRLDRSSDWITETEDTANATDVRITIRGEAKEVELAVDWATTTTTSPTVTGISLESDNVKETRGI